jgi:hypothetical protein
MQSLTRGIEFKIVCSQDGTWYWTAFLPTQILHTKEKRGAEENLARIIKKLREGKYEINIHDTNTGECHSYPGGERHLMDLIAPPIKSKKVKLNQEDDLDFVPVKPVEQTLAKKLSKLKKAEVKNFNKPKYAKEAKEHRVNKAPVAKTKAGASRNKSTGKRNRTSIAKGKEVTDKNFTSKVRAKGSHVRSSTNSKSNKLSGRKDILPTSNQRRTTSNKKVSPKIRRLHTRKQTR